MSIALIAHGGAGKWRPGSDEDAMQGLRAAVEAGRAILAAGLKGPVRVGVIGLGTGTLAGYGRDGDTFRLYEINPQVIDLATKQFSYVNDSRAQVELSIGDARLSLEREPPQGFDVLAVDAFSSDSIPVHLLTAEAFATYFRHLKPGGILAIEDHRAKTDKPQDPYASDGYVREDYAIELARQAGFAMLARSEVNANPKDTKDYPAGVWSLPPTYRLKDQDRAKYQAIGESDRFTLAFVKPKG